MPFSWSNAAFSSEQRGLFVRCLRRGAQRRLGQRRYQSRQSRRAAFLGPPPTTIPENVGAARDARILRVKKFSVKLGPMANGKQWSRGVHPLWIAVLLSAALVRCGNRESSDDTAAIGLPVGNETSTATSSECFPEGLSTLTGTEMQTATDTSCADGVCRAHCGPILVQPCGAFVHCGNCPGTETATQTNIGIGYIESSCDTKVDTGSGAQTATATRTPGSTFTGSGAQTATGTGTSSTASNSGTSTGLATSTSTTTAREPEGDESGGGGCGLAGPAPGSAAGLVAFASLLATLRRRWRRERALKTARH